MLDPEKNLTTSATRIQRILMRLHTSFEWLYLPCYCDLSVQMKVPTTFGRLLGLPLLWYRTTTVCLHVSVANSNKT